MLCLKVDLSLSFMSLCHCLSVDLSPSVTRAPPQGLHEHHSRFQIPIIGIAMGERGLISRLLSPKFNGYLTYAALEAGAISAPGQPTAKDLLDLYNFRLIRPDTKVYGFIGKPVGHSKSPLLFNESFKKVGLNSVYVHLLVDDVKKFFNTY